MVREKKKKRDRGDIAQREDRAASLEWRAYHAGLGPRPRRPYYPSTYLPLLGRAPSLAPGDLRGASEHLSRVEAALTAGGWSKPEHNRLSRMRALWARRASGQDPRFMVVGNRPGGLTTVEQQAIDFHRIALSLRRSAFVTPPTDL